MPNNAPLEMRFSKETDNKLRWDADVAGTRFSIYIPKWRVPEPWPSQILVSVMRLRSSVDDVPNMSVADALANPAIRYEPIVASVTKVDTKTETIQYQPAGDQSKWELGQPYIPQSMTFGEADQLRVIIQWGIAS